MNIDMNKNPDDLLIDRGRFADLDLDDGPAPQPVAPTSPPEAPAPPTVTAPTPRRVQQELPLSIPAWTAPALGHQSEQLIAVSQADESTGAICYWELSGALDLDELAGAWEMEKLDPAWVPEMPSPQAALTRAVRELAAKNIIVRRHPSKEGYVVVVERVVGDGDPKYVPTFRVLLDEVGERPRFVAGDEAVDDALAAKVTAAFSAARRSLATQDVSEWLVRLARRLDCVALRSTGGVYFCPRQSVETLQKVKRALRAAHAPHVVHEIPALRARETVDAIFSACAREIRDLMEEVRAELPELGARAAKSRIEAVDAAAQKLDRYGRLLKVDVVAQLADLARLREKLEKATTRTAQIEV